MSDTYGEPQSRNEAILQNILGEQNELVYPQSRNEAILQAILYNTAYTEEARSRIETLLLCILNGTKTDMQPLSRNEEILIAKINGGTYDKEPQSRIEQLLIDWLNAYEEKTVSGSIVLITDAIAGPVIRCECEVNAKQASGTPTPENPLLISGFTGLNITRTGKNLLDSNKTELTYVTTTAQRYGVTFEGVGNYAVSAQTLSESRNVYAKVYSGGTYGTSYTVVRGTTVTTRTFTLNAGDVLIIYSEFSSSSQYERAKEVLATVQVELGSTATSYETYNGTVYPVTWQTEAGTVYGCIVNPVTGLLTVTHVMDTYTGSDVTSVSTASGNAYARVVMSAISGRTYSTCKCNTYVPTSTSANGNITIPAAGQAVARIFNDSFTTLEAAQAALNAQPVQFVFDLATPQTYQLQAVDVELKQGINNVYHDGNGDITLTYKGG